MERLMLSDMILIIGYSTDIAFRSSKHECLSWKHKIQYIVKSISEMSNYMPQTLLIQYCKNAFTDSRSFTVCFNTSDRFYIMMRMRCNNMPENGAPSQYKVFYQVWWFPLLTHWGQDKMAAFFKTKFLNGFSWMKMYGFRLKFHWSLFLRVLLTIFHPWFR